MSAERPTLVEKKETEPRGFEEEMASLEASLQNLIDGKDVDYEKQMEIIQNQLNTMERKYEGNERVLNFVKFVDKKITGIAIMVGGALALLMKDKTISVITITGGFSLSMLTLYGESKIAQRGKKIVEDINYMIDKSSDFTTEYLKKGGATVVEDEGAKDKRLHLTDEQLDKAYKENEKHS